MADSIKTTKQEQKATRGRDIRAERAALDAKLVDAYQKLPHLSQDKTAKALGVNFTRVEAALLRLGVPRKDRLDVTPARPPSPFNGRVEPLPAGHPVSWGSICQEPWPGSVR